MFSLPWSRPKPERFSLENLKLLCKQLQSFSPDARKEPIITCLKELTQILIWGDQHDPMLLEHFFEQGVHWHFLEILQSKDDGALIVQVLQTLNIMFENVRSRESLYFLLSNNYVNQVICLRYDFSNDEVLAYYIYLLRTLSFKLSKDTINFFFNEHLDDFPLYSEAIKFFNHEESMIRIAVRVITLNVYGVDDQQMQDFILDRTTTTYFSNLVWFIGNYGTTINDILLHPSEGEMSRIDYYLAEHLDCFYYINDIVELEVPKINKILISFVLNRLLRPIYIQSLLPSSAQGSTNIVKSAFASPKLSPAVVLSLLLHAFHVLKYAPLVSALATTIFANQQHGVAHTGHPHPIQSLQQAAGLSPGSSRSSSPASTSRIHSPLALMTSSPSGKHQPPLHPTKEPARAFPATTSSQRAPSRKSSFSDSKIPAGATATQPSCPPSTLVANPYKAVIFGYLSQTENDRLVLPTLLLIYLTCHNTGVMADMLMGTDIYPQRLLKSRVLMGNLMSSSSSLFGPGSGSRAAAGGARADSTPMARGFSADSSMPVHPMHGGVHRDQQNQQHPSLDHTISLSLGSPTSSATTTAITTAAVGVTDGKPHLKTLQPRGGGLSVSAGTGAGGLAGSGVGRSTRTESPLFENSEDDEESRETEELLAGVLPNDVSLPPSPNPLNDSGGAIHGMLMTGGGGDTKSPSSSRALSIRSHVSSSSLGGQGHLPMPQLPSPKVRQTQAFFPSTSVSSSPTPTAQAAVAALSTAITPASTTADSHQHQHQHQHQHHHHHHHHHQHQGQGNVATKELETPVKAVPTAPPVSSSSLTSIITHATMGGASAAADAASVMADDSMTAPSSPHLDELETTRDDGDGGQVHPSPSRVPPPLPPRRLGHGTDGDDDDDDDADPRASMTSSAFPLLPVVQNREELIQRLLDIVTCAGRWDSKEPTPTASPAPGATPSKPPLLASPTSASAHRFRIVTIQVAAELLLEFVYVKGGVPAGSTAAGGGETPMQAKRRASSGAIPSVSRLMSSEGGASSPSSERPAALRVCENMLTEEQLQQILEAENYFRERVRRGVEYLSQDLPGPPKETGNALGKAAADEFLPLGVKTREVERALQQTKLGLEKKVAGMLGDSKLLYGPPPEGDPNVDLDPDQVHDILANIDLRPPEIAPLEHGKDRALGTTEVMTGKESVGRAGRRTSRHLSMDRQQTHGGSGHSSPGVGYQSANQNNNNVNNPRRGRSISRNRLTAFMEDLGSGVFMIGNNTGIRKPTSAGSSSSSLVYPVTSTSASAAAAAAAAAAAGSSSPSTTSTTTTATATATTPAVAACTGYGSANARLSPRTRLEKRVIRSIQWLHILVQCRQLLCHSRNVWSAPIFAGASFGSMTMTPPSATAAAAGGAGVASSWSSSTSSLSSSSTTPFSEDSALTAMALTHPLQTVRGRVRVEPSVATPTPLRSMANKRTERLMETLLESPDPTSSSSSPLPRTKLPLSPPLGASGKEAASGHAKLASTDPLLAAARRSTHRRSKAQFAAEGSTEDEKEEGDEDDDDDSGDEEVEEAKPRPTKEAGVTPRALPTSVAPPNHRLSQHGGPAALLKSAALPALASPSILLSPPAATPMVFAASGGILAAGGNGGDDLHHNARHSRADPGMMSSSAPVGAKSAMMKPSATKSQGGGHSGHHERSASGSSVESTTTDTALEQPQQQQQEESVPTSVFDTRHPWHQKDDKVLGILGSLGFFGAARSTGGASAAAVPR